MNRRSVEQRGFVNFPVLDSQFEDSKEGGMFVRIVVEAIDSWMVCAGGYSFVHFDGSYIGDHNRRRHVEDWPEDPAQLTPNETTKKLHAEHRANNNYDEHHFPNLNLNDERAGELRTHSQTYLCAMVIGSTGWSGYGKSGYWLCQESDLTADGKALIESLRRLYPNCEIRIQTWLDT